MNIWIKNTVITKQICTGRIERTKRMPIKGTLGKKTFKTTTTNRRKSKKTRNFQRFTDDDTQIDTVTNQYYESSGDFDVSASRICAAIRGKKLLPPPKGINKMIAYRKGEYEGGDPYNLIGKATSVIDAGKNAKRKAKKGVNSLKKKLGLTKKR